MLWTIVVILVVLWLLGLVTNVGGGGGSRSVSDRADRNCNEPVRRGRRALG